MTSVQSQLKPYIEEQVERLKKDVALYAEVTALHCGHSNCVNNTFVMMWSICKN